MSFNIEIDEFDENDFVVVKADDYPSKIIFKFFSIFLQKIFLKRRLFDY